jgi:hypothetical protein
MPTTTQETKLGWPQQLVFDKINSRADQAYNTLSEIGPYTGNFVAFSPTQNEREGRRAVLGGANFFGSTGAGRDLLNLGQATARGDFVRPDAPHIRGMIEAATRPVAENYTDVILPSLRSGAAGVGGFDNLRRNLVEAQAGQDYSNTISDLARQIVYGSTMAERDRQNSAGNLIAQSLPMLLAPGQIQAGVGGAERADINAELQNELLKFQEQVSAATRPLNAVTGYQLPLLATGSVTTTKTPNIHPLAALLSGALGGANIGGGLAESLGEDSKWFPGLGGLFGGLAGLAGTF